MSRPAGRFDVGTRGRRRTAIVVSAAFVALAATAAVVIRSGPPGGGGHAGGPAAGSAWTVATKFLLVLAIVMIAAQVAGSLARGLGQPPVVGEILAGLLLGPSALGAVGGSAWHWVFTKDALQVVDVLAQLGLVVFMCLLGSELPLTRLRGRGRLVGAVTLGSFAVPFLSTVLLVPLFWAHRGGSSAPSFALFMGLSIAVTAMPVLARILEERNLTGTAVGALAMSAAALGDLAAWTVLTLVLALAGATGWAAGLMTAGLALALVKVLLIVVRPLMGTLARRCDSGRLSDSVMLVAVLSGAVLSGMAAQVIGIHAAIGGLLFGAVLPRSSMALHRVGSRIRHLTSTMLLPLFFVSIGIHTSIGSLGDSWAGWLGAVLIATVAIGAKMLGTAPIAYAAGWSGRDALSLGALMNCRGLTELIVAGIGFQYGLIDNYLLTVLVIMALLTTALTAPLLALVRRMAPSRDPQAEPAPAGALDPAPPPSLVDSGALRTILGRFATGVVVVTAFTDGGQAIGMTVNSFTAVSLDPPLVLFCAARRSRLHRHFTAATSFAVNILRESQHDISRQFAAPGVDRFGPGNPPALVDGVPVVEGALAVVTCVTENVVPGGDHDIVVGRVTHLDQAPGFAEDPLIFYRGGYRILHADPADWAAALA